MRRNKYEEAASRFDKYFNDKQNAEVSSYNKTLDGCTSYHNLDLLKSIPSNHILARMAKAVSFDAQVPESSVLLAILTTFSSMACRKYRIEYYDGTILPIGLYCIIEQPSGSGKSRVLNAAQAPFKQEYKRIIDNCLISADKDELAAIKSKYFITNTTPEALEKMTAKAGGFFSCASSEQALLSTLIGNIYGTFDRPKNNELVLCGFDGGFFNSSRITREGYSGNVVGSILCFAQAGSVGSVLNASSGTGLSERFLMATEEHWLGKRKLHLTGQENKALALDYYDICCRVFSFDSVSYFEGHLCSLRLTDNGYLLLLQYCQALEHKLADGGRYSSIAVRGSAAKINMQILKIAANLHLMSGNDGLVITDSVLFLAIDIAGDMLESNYKISGILGITGDKAEYSAILSLFEKDSRPRTERNIIQSKSGNHPFKEYSGNKSDRIREALNKMVSEGILLVNYTADVKPIKLYRPC